MSQCKVLCYGGITIESAFELPDQPIPGVSHIICQEHYRLGGGAANVAEWLGSWDVPTRLAGYAIGDDRYGDQIWQWLNEYATLDLRYIKRLKGINTLVARSIPFPDGNKYLFCSDFAKAELSPITPDLLDDVQILEIAFYYRNPRGNAAAAELAKMAYNKGIKIVAMDVLSPTDETLPLADVVINSVASIVEQYPGANILQHSKVLQKVNKGVVITTDGSRQVYAIDRDGSVYSLLPPKVSVTESTGAGDSFRAGIIYGLLQQWPLERLLLWATAVGALQVQRSLDQDRPPAKVKIAELAKQIEIHRQSSIKMDHQ